MGDKLDKATAKAGEFAKAGAKIALDLRGEASNQAKRGMRKAREAAGEANRSIQLKRLNPLFPETYNSSDYSIPEMIVVVDGAVRKNEEVCKGAIGWTSQEAQMLVLHLYESFAEQSGISFYPAAKIDSVYLEDPSNSKRYIDLGLFFNTIENEKAAELIEIGRCLGAKKCVVQAHEEEKRVSLKRGDANAKGKTLEGEIGVGVKSSFAQTSQDKCTLLSFQEFPGSNIPQRPPLHWFANDTAITNLVDSFFDSRPDLNPTKVRREVSHSSSQTMSSKKAGRIEAALKKLGAQMNFSLDGEAQREERQTWILDIEF